MNAEEDLSWMADAYQRLTNGKLYKIRVKPKDKPDDEGQVVPFLPNRAQRRWLKRMWSRNVILKARQLGFTTLICLIWLDHALFVANQHCVIIAQDLGAAAEIFRDKIKVGYENLPDELREAMPLASDTKMSYEFAHNKSVVRVTTSARSGMVDRLHVSEFGKICKRTPDKAREVVTGSFPAVSQNGIIVVESTAEGRDGPFYKMVQQAEKRTSDPRPLNPKEFRLQFFPWWDEPTYQIQDPTYPVSYEDEQYFEGVEAKIGHTLTHAQRVWWLTTCEVEFQGDQDMMFQEYPSTVDEAFQVSSEGVYYAKQLSKARKDGRLTTPLPVIPGRPVYTLWDIGKGDGTGVWLCQDDGPWVNVVAYIEGWGEGYDYFAAELVKWAARQGSNIIWDEHLLPHDAGHMRQTAHGLTCAKDELKKTQIPGTFKIVPRIDDLSVGINLTRALFARLRFDPVGCKEGLDHLANYRKAWNEHTSTYSSHPLKNDATEAADALRQLAQWRANSDNGVSGDDVAKWANRKRKR